MDYREKLELATRLLDLTMQSPRPASLPDKALPPAVLERIEEVMKRRRTVMAELYVERLSEEQLLALDAWHGSDLARAMAAELPGIVAEAHRRMEETWGRDGGDRNRAFPAEDPRPIARIGTRLEVSGTPHDTQADFNAVQRLLDEERFIQTTHQNLVRNLLTALGRGAGSAELARFYCADAEQIEQPNRLNPAGGCSNLATLLARADKGRQLMREQHYEVETLVASGNSVAAEVRWTGTLAVPLGALTAGAELRARIALFFDFKDGRIHRQRNYDCFEAW